MTDFIENCRKFIELDSTPAAGNADIVEFGAELCRAAGLYVEIQSEMMNGVRQTNLIARPNQIRPPQEILLQTHLDTCDPGSYGLWTKTGANPFAASVYTDANQGSDVLYGLGAAATKLDFLCKLQAMQERPSRGWRVPPVLVGTFGEETGMHGAIKLIRKKMISATMAMVGEPTNMALVSSGKGFAAVEIEIPFADDEKKMRAAHDLSDASTTRSRMFVGKAAHSSVPQIGESAVLQMLDYLMKLPEGLVLMEMEGGINTNTVPAHAVLEIDMVAHVKETIASKITRIMKVVKDVELDFLNYADPAFEPPIPTLSIGLVRTFEDVVKFSGCCRLTPLVSNSVYENWIGILRHACASVGGLLRVTEYKEPFRTPNDSPLVQLCQNQLAKQGLPMVLRAQSVANEANVFSRFGIPCVVIGPGQGVGNSHAPNEHVRIDQLHQAIQFYQGVLQGVSS